MNYDPTTDLIGLIRRRFWRLLVVCAIAGAAAILYTWAFVPREYVASCRLLYESGSGRISGAFSGIASKLGIIPARQADVGSTLMEILTSRTFALKMIRQFELATRLGARNDLEAVPRFGQWLGIEVRPGGVLVISYRLMGSPRGLTSRGHDQQTTQLAADIVNSLVAELQQYRQQTTYEAAKRQRIYVEQRLEETEEKFQQALARLSAFQQKTGIMQPQVQLQAAYAALGNVDSALARAKAAAQAARQAAEAASQSEGRTSVVVAQTPLITGIKSNLVTLQMELARAQQVERKTAAHPEVRSLLVQIEDARRSLAQELELEVAALAVQQMVAETEVEALTQERQRLYQSVQKFPVGSVEYVKHKADVDLLVAARAALYQEREIAAIEQEASYRPFEVLDPAVPPLRKSAPPTLLNAVAAAFLVGIITLLMAARQEKLTAPKQEVSSPEN